MSNAKIDQNRQFKDDKRMIKKVLIFLTVTTILVVTFSAITIRFFS